MKIFVSAAEISSDLQAEKIIRELIRLYPEKKVQIAGIGGPKLRSLPHFQTIEKAENLRVMGFTEVVGKIFKIRNILKNTLRFLENYQPDLILTFDYPDFHFSLLKACAKIPQLKKTVKICGIPPKIWVWRAKRIEQIRELYHAVWVLFPFEKKIYEDAGIPVIFEGNPLIGEVIKSAHFPKPEWISNEAIRLAVMPGSRDAEIKKHLEIIPATLALLAQKTGKKIIAEIPVPAGISLDNIHSHLMNTERVSYEISEGSSASVLARNSIGLIKSGTSTLEAATLACAPVIFYRVSLVTEFIFRFLIRYTGAVGLPNILLGVKKRKSAIFPELLGPEATPEALSEALFKLIESPAVLSEKQKAGESLRGLLVPFANIPERIAFRMKEVIERNVKTRVLRQKRISVQIISFLWSALNFTRRKIKKIGIFKPYKISTPSILIGNLQAGGAGKTPLVIAIAEEAIRRGFRVGVISRGYGGNFKEPTLLLGPKINFELRKKADLIGDEPAEILEALPEVTLGLGADRVKTSKELEKIGINFLIFDDGFQNLKFHAQKTVLAMTDATPSELIFRDFFSQTLHADLILQTKGFPRRAPVLATPVKWEVASLPPKPIWLLCALADPREVEQFYRNLGVLIEKTILFSDHETFDLEQVKAWQAEAQALGAVLAVTAKDWVKLKSDNSLTPFVLRRKIVSEGWLETLFKR